MEIHYKNRPLSSEDLKDQINDGTISIDLIFTEKHLNQSIIRRLLKFYTVCVDEAGRERLKNINGEIRFHMDSIKIFELSFLATLSLIKYRIPNINIILIFSGLNNLNRAPKVFWQFVQFMITSQHKSPLFQLKYNNKLIKPTPNNLEIFLVSSTRYLPLLNINHDTYRRYFKEPFISIWNDSLWNEISINELENFFEKKHQNKRNFRERLYQSFRSYIISHTSSKMAHNPNEIKFDDLINILSLLHALRKIACIILILKNNKGEIQNEKIIKHVNVDTVLGIKGFSLNDCKEYLIKIEKRINILFERPVYFVMIFCKLIENSFAFSRLKNNDINQILRDIDSLFSFSAQLFDGLNELIKNVLEHTEDQRGILSLRLYRLKDLENIKMPEFKKYISEARLGEKKNIEFIDFVLLDDSESGILSQTSKKLCELKDEFENDSNEQKIIKNDIKRISDNTITLKDFFTIHNTPLLHQEIRMAASLGLLIFSDFVKKNNGITYISTIDNSNVKASLVSTQSQENISSIHGMPVGTYYNVLFPVVAKSTFKYSPSYDTYETVDVIDAYEEILKIKLHDIGDIREIPSFDCDKKSRCIKKIKIQKDDIAYASEQKEFFKFKKCITCPFRTQMILAIQLDGDLKEVDPSEIFRFLARVQYGENYQAVIVYNIKERSLKRLLEILKIWEKICNRAWSSKQIVLFYYLPENYNYKQPRYYTWVIGGKKYQDSIKLNQIILRTNKGYMLDNPIIDKNDNDSTFINKYHNNPLFSKNGHLLPFDTLLTENEHSLFEWNTLAALNTSSLDGKAVGYRFKKVHIRLGSKIHVDEFIYAKRLFQNSYYALRFGYQVANYLDTNQKEWYGNHEGAPIKRLCILSYGVYSELMVSTAAHLLGKKRKEWVITHAILNDIETGKIEKDISNYELVIIIPIASTLSTVIKIKYILQQSNISFDFNNISINLIVAGHKKIDSDLIDSTGTVVDPVVGKFWRKIDTKSKLITLCDKDETIQKYNLYLEIGWHLPAECKLCHPTDKSNRKEETPLFTTDKVSVTPLIIFGYPQGKQLPQTPTNDICWGNTEQLPFISKEMVAHGHIERGKNHYLYYIDTEEFFNKNKIKIESWCRDAKTDLKLKIGERYKTQTFLIAPAHTTNSKFVRFVNNHTFGGTATIFYYDPQENFSENIDRSFLQAISEEAEIYFVDDALCSATTYFQINNFVKCHDNFKGFNGVFVLLNRLNAYTQDIICKDVNGIIYSFINLEAPVIRQEYEQCHLCKEKERYELILNSSILDSTKISYMANMNRIKSISVFDMPPSQEDGKKYLFRLNMIHSLYTKFRKDSTSIIEIFEGDQDIDRLMDYLNVNREKDKVDLLKLLSRPFFSNYSNIRKCVLKWIIVELENTFQKIQQNKVNDVYGVLNLYRYSKMLIKRLAFLQSNFLIRIDTLENIRDFYDNYKQQWRGKIEKEIKKQRTKSKKVAKESIQTTLPFTIDDRKHKCNVKELERLMHSLDNFNLHYADAVKAIVWDDEYRSLILEKNLNKIDPGSRTGTGKSFHSLLRILRVENVYFLTSFLDWVKEAFSEKLSFAFKNTNYEEDVDLLLKLLRYYKLDRHYKMRPLFEYLKVDSTTIYTSTEFTERIIPLILLKLFVNQKWPNENQAGEAMPKMDYILFLLCKIIDINVGKNGGAFCVASCGFEGSSATPLYYEVATVPSSKSKPLFNWQLQKNAFSNKIIEGYKSENGKYPWVNVEFVKKEDFLETYSGEAQNLIEIYEAASYHDEDTQSYEKNHYFFLRLSCNNENQQQTGTGALVFYRQQNEFLDEKYLRYILLLRNEISEFVKVNFNNSSFRSWLWEQKELLLIDTMQHGFKRELDHLEYLIKKNKQTIEEALSTKFIKEFYIYHDIIYNKIKYTKLVKRSEESSDIHVALEDIGIKKSRFSLDDFLQYVKEMAIMVYKSSSGGISFNDLIIELPSEKIGYIFFYKSLLHDALFEFIRNAKKHVDERKREYEQQSPKLNFSIVTEGDEMFLCVEDNGMGVNKIQESNLNELGYSNRGRGLHMFSYLWKTILGKQFVFKSVEYQYFKVKIPIISGG